MPSLDDLAFETERDIGTIRSFFPILPSLGNRWAQSRPWEGRTIALNVHVTSFTAALVQEMTLGGASMVVSVANPATTDPGAVQLLRTAGVEVLTGADASERHAQLLSYHPSLLVDTGSRAIQAALERPDTAATLVAAVETTRSGMLKLRDRPRLPLPVVNLHDGRLREAIDNRHTVGEAVWDAVGRLTGLHLAGRRALVIGYGGVGRGVALAARSHGLAVEVVESDPVRRLYAHYDGHPTPALLDAIGRANLVITATGRPGVLPADLIEAACDRVILANAGTGGDEIDVAGVRRAAVRMDIISDGITQYRFESGRSAFVLGDGHPINIVANSGSAEPVLLQFALLGLTLEWLARHRMGPGEHGVPAAIEEEAALLALRALAIPDP